MMWLQFLVTALEGNCSQLDRINTDGQQVDAKLRRLRKRRRRAIASVRVSSVPPRLPAGSLVSFGPFLHVDSLPPPVSGRSESARRPQRFGNQLNLVERLCGAQLDLGPVLLMSMPGLRG
jgi:hypothetical protein